MASECDITIETEGNDYKIIVDGRDITRFVTAYEVESPKDGPVVISMHIERGANLVIDGFALLEGDDGVNHFTVTGPSKEALPTDHPEW